MNRIRELREAKGLTGRQLAEMIGTTQETISRLETGRRKLTHDWMRVIAKALGVTPADLITAPELQDVLEDAAPHADTFERHVSRAIQARNLALWRVTTDALENIGLTPGNVRLFDLSEAAIANVRTGDVVLLELRDARRSSPPKMVLRQFVAPNLIVTNRRATNIAVSMDHHHFTAHIVGVMVRDQD